MLGYLLYHVIYSLRLARNEPTLGNHPQGESTPYALRLLGEHIVFVSSCVPILGPTP